MITQQTINTFREKYYVDKATNCWLWTGKPTWDGYGQIRIKGQQYRAHRLSYLIHKGEIPERLYCCHTCDVRICVNPEHLFLGTQRENVADEIAKNRHIYGSNHPRSKLDDIDIGIMLALLREGYNYTFIASKLNIAVASVGDIAKGRCRFELSELMKEADKKPSHLIEFPELRLYWKRTSTGWKQYKRRIENQRAVELNKQRDNQKICKECTASYFSTKSKSLFCSSKCCARDFRKRHPGKRR